MWTQSDKTQEKTLMIILNHRQGGHENQADSDITEVNFILLFDNFIEN